ncbi:MAG: SIR2 family protein [Acidobacteriota bacterium]
MTSSLADHLEDRDRRSLEWLGQQVAADKVVLFIGAGLSRNAVRKDGSDRQMPDWWSLAETLRSGLEKGLEKETDVLKIADYYQTTFGRTALVEKVSRVVADSQYEPAEVHRLLVRMRLREIITTNYDTLIERAFQQESIIPHVVVTGSDLVHPSPLRIIKMNGCLDRNPSRIVLTGDDFLAYSATHPLIQAFVTKCFVESRVLFIGFSLEDPAFRAINERVLATLGDDTPYAHSLWFHPTETQKEYWLNHKIRIVDILPPTAAESIGHTEAVEKALGYIIHVQDDLVWPKMANQPTSLGHALCPKRAQENCPERAQENRPERLEELCRTLAEDLRSDRPPSSVGATRAIAALERTLHPDLWLQAKPNEAAFVEQLIDHIFEANERSADDHRRLWTQAVPTVTFLTLILLIIARSLYNGDPKRTRAAAIRAIRAMRRLEPNCLKAGAAAIRWKALALMCLTCPLEALGELIAGWSRSEEDSAKIPDLVKAPVLAFHGLLFEQHEVPERAARAVFSVLREITEPGTVSSADDLEIAYRYRYLMRAIPESQDEWHGTRHYLGEIEQALGQSMLRPSAAGPLLERPTIKPDSSAHHLLMVLRALLRGWIYGTGPPESIRLAWEMAALEEARNDSDLVPWEALILLSLATDGRRLIDDPTGLLHRAWLREEVDVAFLIDYIALRVQGDGFQALAKAGAIGEDRGARIYERHLAHLVRWITQQVATEKADSELRTKLIADLAEPVAHWLFRTPDEVSRVSLLYTLAELRTWKPQQIRPLIQQWVESQLLAHTQLHLGLSLLAPSDEEPTFESTQLRRLIDLADQPSYRGRQNLIKWLVSWSSSEVFDDRALAHLAQVATTRLVEDAEIGNLAWLSLAARLQRTDRLRRRVEDLLAGSDNASNATLLGFVKSRLQALDRKQAKRWRDKRIGFSDKFVPFADQVDDQLRKLILGKIEPQNAYGRERAVRMLAALVVEGSEELRKAHGKDWLSDLEATIQAGATGEGHLGPVVGRLSEVSRAKLQNNLIAAVFLPASGAHIIQAVGWIEQTLAGSTEPLRILENGLVELIATPSLDVAQASLETVLGLCRDEAVAGFLDRQRHHLGRQLVIARTRGGYRSTSQFAADLDALGELIAS